jgi:hypothetical protein
MGNKTSNIEENFIKIPKDFKSEHDLEELLEHAEYLQRLANSVSNYKAKYVESFYKSADEVLKFIPKNQHKLYEVFHRDKCITERKDLFPEPSEAVRKKRHNDLIEKGIEMPWHSRKWLFPKYTLSKIIRTTAVKDEKMFLVDTVNHIVHVCYWVSSLLSEIPRNPRSTSEVSSELTYSLGTSASIHNKLIYVKARYSWWGSEKVGGVMIRTGNGNSYNSGGKWQNCIRYDSETFVFCTQTNKLLGTQSTYEKTQKENEK